MTCKSLSKPVAALIVAASLTVVCRIAIADSPAAAIGFVPIQTGTFRSPLLNRDLVFRVFAPNEPAGQPMPMVVYVKNLAVERLGTVSDKELIGSFLNDGMLVVEVDYQKDARAHGANMYVDVLYLYRVFGANRGINPEKPSFGPLMDEFIRWDEERIATYDRFVACRGTETAEYIINPLWVYVIPEGFTIDRNVEVSTIQTDQRTVVHRMDVIHPASPATSVPAVLEISTTIPQEDPSLHTRINRNSCYVFTWIMAGYAAVILDNVANHVTSTTIYGKRMTVPTGPYFPEKRALRLLRARKSDWGLSGKVAVMGISKSSLRAIMAALVGDERPDEEYSVEVDKGPHADQPDRFDAMIAGDVPRKSAMWQVILDYLSDDAPALVWCQSDLDALVLSGPATKDAHFNLKPRRNAASVHLMYPVPNDTKVAAFYCEVTAVEDPLWTFYMACGWHRGYFGMQVNSPQERRIIFSVWDTGGEARDRSKVGAEDRVKLVDKGEGVHTNAFGGEGTGGHSHLVYRWKTGEKQQFLVMAQPVDATHTIYSGFYFLRDKEKWMLISSWRAPKEGGYMRRPHSFSENFGGGNGHLVRKALYGNQWIRDDKGQWIELTTATFSHDATGRADRLDRFMGVENGQFFLSHGGFVPGFTEFRKAFTRPAAGKAPSDIVLPEIRVAPPPRNRPGR